MGRRAIPREIETSVLVKSRRRCCICFGLDRDTRLKSGQIAHLDGDRENNAESNLAFLCLEHHDAYDSKTSQRKGLTISEVKDYRRELQTTINKAFTQQVHFGEIRTPPSDPYAGDYVRLGGESAEITLTPLPDSYEGNAQYFVRGFALWGNWRENGPNLGTLEFVGEVRPDRTIVHTESFHGGDHTVTIAFLGNGAIDVSEENWLGVYGMNVNFIGSYQRNLQTT